MSWFRNLFTPPMDPNVRIRILFVCRANITRSPFLEHLLRQRIQERFPEVASEIQVSSSGVEAVRHCAADPVICGLALQQGIDLTDHSSRPVRASIIKQADWIFTLEESFVRQIKTRFRGSEDRIFPLPMFGNSDMGREEWDIADPTGKEVAEYEAFVEIAGQEVDRLLRIFETEFLRSRQALVLIGLPGSGKTTAGKEVAEKLGWPFVDTDRVIEEQEQCSLQEILDQRGLDALRRLEEQVITRLAPTQCVLATGGSAVLSTRAMSHLRRMGKLIWLEITPQTCLDRIGSGEGRGLVKSNEQTLEDMIAQRDQLYSRWAEHRIKADGPLQDTVEEIQSLAASVVQPARKLFSIQMVFSCT